LRDSGVSAAAAVKRAHAPGGGGSTRSSGGVNNKKLGFNNQFNMENMKNIGFSPSILL